MTRLSQTRRAATAERGAVTVFTVVVVFALFVAIGLVVDGGAKIHATQRAQSLAEEAARAGGQAIVFDAGGGPVLDPSGAIQAAQTYLNGAPDGVSGRAWIVSDTEIAAEATVTYDTIFLSMIGVPPGSVTRDATARLAPG